MRFFAALAATLLLCVGASAKAAAEEQVFITLTGDAREMAVSWVTMTAAPASEEVHYGTAAGALTSSATATSSVFSDQVAPMRIHVATMTGLAANTTYFYSVGASAAVQAFTAAPARADATHVYAVFGDLGLEDDYSMSSLLAEAAAGAFDVIVHAGDIAYDLETNNGQVGNDYMKTVQPMTSSIPYLVEPGNHETMSDNSFSNYLARFAALGALGTRSGSNTTLYFSVNDGPIHWLFVDTELYSYGSKAQIKAQIEWLEADLSAVDRAETPWIVSAAHKGYWEKNTDWDALGLNAAFAKYNVDLAFLGHTHNYQRTSNFLNGAPAGDACMSGGGTVYTDCVGTIGILAGSPGMNQGMGTRSVPADIRVMGFNRWGYGHLVATPTTLVWSWFEVATSAGALPWGTSANTDSITIVRNSRR